MRPKYKLGETVFFTVNHPESEVPTQSKAPTQAFGQIALVTVTIGYGENNKTITTVQYRVGDAIVDEDCILGKAIIQKPRVRKTRSRKAMDDLKKYNGSANAELAAQFPNS